MKFGLFYEHQLPQPWEEDSEQRLYHQALDQIELADRLGIDYVWEVGTIFSRNTRTPPHPRCFSRPARNARNTSVSVTASP